MGIVNKIIDAAKAIASNNNNVYGKYPNNMGPNTWDCCTFLSKALYDAGVAPGEWHDHGYFWPHISESGFDWFLVEVCGMTKMDYIGDGMLIPGDILISRESYGHTAMFLGNWKMIEAHDQYAPNDQIGIHDWFEYDWCFVYRIEGGYTPEKEQTFIERFIDITNWTISLKKGDKNDYVELVQKYLAYWGHYDGSIDKDFGDYTETGLIGWQKRNGLTSDGVVDADDWEFMEKHPM